MAAEAIVAETTQRPGGTEALSQWINNVRTKRYALRKKGELRAIVVLGRTLRKAEDELQRRQRARALRWAKLQPLLVGSDQGHAPTSAAPPSPSDPTWQSELSKLDDFFKDIDSVFNSK